MEIIIDTSKEMFMPQSCTRAILAARLREVENYVSSFDLPVSLRFEPSEDGLEAMLYFENHLEGDAVAYHTTLQWDGDWRPIWHDLVRLVHISLIEKFSTSHST
jgi:hypothetical protein